VILKRTESGKLDLMYMHEFAIERQIAFKPIDPKNPWVEKELEPGEYIVLPLTSGCSIQRPEFAKRVKKIQLLGKDGQLTPIAALTARDIFRRLDSVSVENSLQLDEVNLFLDRGYGEQMDMR